MPVCFGTPEGTRTPNPQNRNLMLYPLSHRRVCSSIIADPFEKVKLYFSFLENNFFDIPPPLRYNEYNTILQEGSTVKLQESGEMYLETILILSRQKSSVRAVDVGEYMGFSKPSVSRGVHILMDAGYLRTDENGFLQLTEQGLARAEKIYARHNVLSSFFRQLGISEQTAVDDACKVEHYISDETYEAIKRFVEQKS